MKALVFASRFVSMSVKKWLVSVTRRSIESAPNKSFPLTKHKKKFHTAIDINGMCVNIVTHYWIETTLFLLCLEDQQVTKVGVSPQFVYLTTNIFGPYSFHREKEQERISWFSPVKAAKVILFSTFQLLVKWYSTLLKIVFLYLVHTIIWNILQTGT